MSHYEVLGVDHKATRDDLRSAFRAQARRWHPDFDPSPEAPERFHRVMEAWAVLRNPHQRRRYDARVYRNHSTAGAGGTISFARRESLASRARKKLLRVLRSLRDEQPPARVR